MDGCLSYMESDYEDLAQFMSAFANPKRLKIIEILLHEEISVNDLATRLGISQSSLSQHLYQLRVHDIVSVRRESQFVFYRCDIPQIRRLMKVFSEIWPLPQEL